MSFIIHRVEDVTSYVRTKATPGGTLPGTNQEQRLEAEIITRGLDLQKANEALREKDEQLELVNRELDDFATIVSHDLKAPLRGIATLAKWVQSDYAEKLDEEGRGNLEEMVKRVSRMDRMIEGILQYSRAGRTDEKPVPVRTSEVVAQLASDIVPNEHVHLEIAPTLPTIEGDPTRIDQVFQNLLSNAIKYAEKPDVTVSVGCEDQGEYWEFRISDNGPGIEERYFERIFRPFETLSPKDKTDSTGIGLSLVKRIVERAGGKVQVKSRVGEGTTFYFTWPKRRAVMNEAGGVTEPLAQAGNM